MPIWQCILKGHLCKQWGEYGVDLVRGDYKQSDYGKVILRCQSVIKHTVEQVNPCMGIGL